MRAARPAASLISSRGAKLLIGLPLLLAAFALTLQWSGPRPDTSTRLTLSGLPNSDGRGFGGKTRSLIAENGQQIASAGAVQQQQPDRGVAQKGKGSEAWRPGEAWKPGSFKNETGPKIAFVSTTSEGYRQTRLWVNYHRVIGVTHFYLFVDGQAARPEVKSKLEQLPGVKVIPRDDALKYKHSHSRIWNETWLSAFFHKPCNHELFVLQSLNMEEGIRIAFADKVDWILHIDTDELMYPGGAAEYSLQRLLADTPAAVDTLVFPNYESLPERADVTNPFSESCPWAWKGVLNWCEEVTLFKRNYHHVVPDTYFKNYHDVARGNPNYFITYGNGKSAARMQPGIRPNGAHRWYSYTKAPREETSDRAAVLHYTYNKFSDLKSRRDRCDCAPTDEDAKRCFILPFDRMAFLAASMKTDEELEVWFKERLVWTDENVVNDLVKSGLFIRAYEPQVIMRGIPEEESEPSSSKEEPPPTQTGNPKP